jgi:hypothetical protein
MNSGLADCSQPNGIWNPNTFMSTLSRANRLSIDPDWS